jgi:hypothetical protein
MSSQPQRDDQDERGRVVPFRPRPARKLAAFSNLEPQSPVRDVDPNRSAGRGDDDYRHRMKMNAIALIVLIGLIGGGIWIVDVMAKMRKDQDCVLSGRRNCTPVSTPAEIH